MSTATRLPERCRVYLDNTLLPERVNSTGLPVPLSPFTIEWGVSAPWDAAVPAVLKITFIDPDGDYSRVYTTLAGHRITIAPDWTENGIDNGPNPVKYCMFDGIITDVQILANDAGHDRLSITASDRIYVLRNDCRKGPNWNQHEEMVQGFQWWPKGNIGPQIKAWLANDGINNYWLPWSTFLAGIKADQKSSLLDWLESVKTRQINGTYTLEINRSVFMSYKGQPSTVPSLEAVYLNWDVETVLAGARIITGDDGTDITRDHRYADAENVLIDENPTLTAPDSYYTQLELRYSHLKLASSSSGQLYEVSQDGSLVKQIETATYEGENCLSVTVNWADSGASQNNINVLDTTRAENYLKTQNQRVRLPPDHLPWRPVLADVPLLQPPRHHHNRIALRAYRAGHPWPLGRHRRHAHLRRDQQTQPLGSQDQTLPRAGHHQPGQTDLRGTEKTDGSHVRPMQLETRRAALRHENQGDHMTVTTTPTFGLPYPEDNEPIAHLPDILQQQAEGIEKALTRFDFNGTDANRYAARLAAIESILAGYSPLLGALGTVRIGKPTYDPAKITLNDALLVRFNNLVIASMRFVYNAGVITHDNASYSPFTVPQGFGKAGSIRNRISITHNLIAPGTDDACISGHTITQWSITNSTSEFSLLGIWTADDE